MPWSAYVQNGSRISFGYVPMGTLVPFVFLALGLNLLLKRVWPAQAFTRAELGIIFVMALAAAIFPTLGLVGFMVALLATPYYYASPENQWDHYILPYLPRYAIPTDEGGAMGSFFNGLPPGQSFPWDVWIVPLFWWISLVAALFAVAFCSMSILRKQWVEKERLLFPLVEVPRLMADEVASDRGWDLTKRPLFWIGLAVPLVMVGWNMVSFIVPAVPTLRLITDSSYVHVARGFPSIRTKFNFFVISFAYFTNLELLFSIWFFNALKIVQMGIFNRVGFTIGRPDLWGTYDAALTWQSFGAFVVLVLWGLWTARSHLALAFRKALHPCLRSIDDRGEMMSYRSAFIGLVLALMYLVIWFRRLGMQWGLMALFLFGSLIIYIGVAKVVAQTGLVYMRAPMTAQTFAAYSVGSQSIEPASMVALALTFGFCCDFKQSIFYTIAHGDKLAADSGASKRVLVWGTVLALVLGFFLSLAIVFWLAYGQGAANYHAAWELNSGNLQIVNDAVSKMRNATGPDAGRLAFLGIGAAAGALLTYASYRLAWWPLHPLGFAVSGTTATHAAAFSIFLVWLAKTIILRLAGVRGYERGKPLFVGVLVGYVLAVGIAFIVDCIWFPGMGHRIHHW